MQLHALVDDLLLHVGHPILRHRGRLVVEFALHQLHDAVVDEHPRHARDGRALGELEADVLHLADDLTEGLALLHVLRGLGDSAFHRADAAERDDETLVGQIAHQLIHAEAFLRPEPAVRGHAHILEEELGGVLCRHAHLVEHATDAVTGEVLRLDHDQR